MEINQEHIQIQLEGLELPRLKKTMELILSNRPVSLAYLYGSAAKGQTTPFSDVDIALLTIGSLPPYDMYKLILGVQQSLYEAIGIPNIDVRIINEAPLVFQGRVVTEGILLYARDDRERVAYETGTRLRYFDYLPIHSQIQAAFFADVKEKGLHGRSRQG
jgi:predicted nucleotidyltransferase